MGEKILTISSVSRKPISQKKNKKGSVQDNDYISIRPHLEGILRHMPNYRQLTKKIIIFPINVNTAHNVASITAAISTQQ